MKLLRTVSALGLAKAAYDIARKPENQRRLKQAVAQVQARRARARTAR